jgi:hypothetical protein
LIESGSELTINHHLYSPAQAAKVVELANQHLTWEDVPKRFKLEYQPKGKRYFVYQPTGGWGNQRMIIRFAVMIANATNRTLVIGPTGPHTSLYYNFNKLPATDLVNLGRILDLELLDSVVKRGIVVHNDTMASLQDVYMKDLKWKIYNHKRFVIVNGKSKRNSYSKAAVKSKFGTSAYYKKYDVIFWEKGSMWMCCSYSHELDPYVAHNDHLKAVARLLMRNFTDYNAIHVRRGDRRMEHQVTKSVRKCVKSDIMCVCV